MIVVLCIRRSHFRVFCSIGWESVYSFETVGVLHDSPRAPNVHIPRVHGASKTTKIQREDTQRETKRAKIPAGEGKKERNFGRSRERAVQGEGGPGKGGPGKAVLGKGGPGGTQHDQTKTLKPTPTPHSTNTHQHTQTHTNTHKHTAQVELGLAKVGLAKVGFGQSRFWPKSAIPLKH